MTQGSKVKEEMNKGENVNEERNIIEKRKEVRKKERNKQTNKRARRETKICFHSEVNISLFYFGWYQDLG
jgi:hypothetical protein